MKKGLKKIVVLMLVFSTCFIQGLTLNQNIVNAEDGKNIINVTYKEIADRKVEAVVSITQNFDMCTANIDIVYDNSLLSIATEGNDNESGVIKGDKLGDGLFVDNTKFAENTIKVLYVNPTPINEEIVFFKVYFNLNNGKNLTDGAITLKTEELINSKEENISHTINYNTDTQSLPSVDISMVIIISVVIAIVIIGVVIIILVKKKKKSTTQIVEQTDEVINSESKTEDVDNEN